MDNTSFAPGNNSINNSVPPPSPQYSVPEHKHFLNKKFAITFVILILLGAGAYAGISYWQNQQLAQEVMPTFTPRPSASATPDVTSDWKTYTNKQYGFEIQTPNNWTVTEANNSLIFKSQKTIAAEVQNVIDCSPSSTKQCNSDGVPADMIFQPVSSIKDAASGSVKTKNINGLQFFTFSTLGMVEVPTYEINYKNKIYNFSSTNMNQNDFEKILSTFKFTK